MTTTSPNYRMAYIIGLFLCAVSFIIYLASSMSDERSDFLSGSFFINFILAIGYLFVLLFSKLSLEHPRESISSACWVNELVLFTISAFSLNQSMNVFAPFPLWLNIYTLAMIGVLLALPYVNNLRRSWQIIIYTLSGASLLLSVYMFIFLLPIYPVTLITFWFFGLSLHAFVPLLWILAFFIFLIKKSEEPRLKRFIALGALIPLSILSIYLIKWNGLQRNIGEVLAQKNAQLTNRLLDDILLAQKLPNDPMTELILVSQFNSQELWRDVGFSSIGVEGKYHDPLAILAIELFGNINVDRQTVVSVLNIRRDYRHKTRERLWTGTSLSTISVSSNIKVFPSYRMAYHEKTFVINNSGIRPKRDFWFSTQTQEALYTFHLPEGSIVTSLSLWINGKEEKSRLTTTSKADSAYKQIVGVQRRDPALVHWQEGNRVTVNIFPCTVNENRTFKIGFTTPLKTENRRLVLENIWFEGPDFENTQETTHLICEEAPLHPEDIPEHFTKNLKNEYEYTGEYIPYWKIEMDEVPLSQNKFSFGGYDYTIKPSVKTLVTSMVKEVYLDVTKEWTEEEYNKVINELPNKDIYIWSPEKIKLTKENKELAWDILSKNQFSMPFLFNIKHAQNAVIITKGGHRSPLLSEMKSSEYAVKSTEYFNSSNNKVQVINIGNELSPLWRSLRELRLIDYESHSLDEALKFVSNGMHGVNVEDSTLVILNDSQLSINKIKTKDSLTTGNAPDHLMRVFAYNDILRKMGRNYFNKEKLENDWIREAEEAYVVTPVSSMIVLESTEDYDKMGIKKNKNTLGNASVEGGGAVPEPHEWLLITMVVGYILYYLYQKRKKKLAGEIEN